MFSAILIIHISCFLTYPNAICMYTGSKQHSLSFFSSLSALQPTKNLALYCSHALQPKTWSGWAKHISSPWNHFNLLMSFQMGKHCSCYRSIPLLQSYVWSIRISCKLQPKQMQEPKHSSFLLSLESVENVI